MILSDKKKFIFIHIFKTAGTSISDELLPYARLKERFVYQFRLTRKLVTAVERIFKLQDEGQKRFTGFHKHSTANAIKTKLGDSTYANYFTFCFVRNPYDHMVSLYHYIRESKSHKFNQQANRLTFTEFVAFYIGQSPLRQVDFIFNKDEKIVEFIGRFENISEDFKSIADRIGIKSKNLGVLNSSRRGDDFMRYFDDERTLIMFNRYFENDFKYLGYSVQSSPKSRTK